MEYKPDFTNRQRGWKLVDEAYIAIRLGMEPRDVYPRLETGGGVAFYLAWRTPDSFPSACGIHFHSSARVLWFFWFMPSTHA